MVGRSGATTERLREDTAKPRNFPSFTKGATLATFGEGHGHASSQEIGHGRSPPAILSAGSGRPAGARATPHIGFPDFSSSKVTATAPIADNRTFSPSTSATRPRSL